MIRDRGDWIKSDKPIKSIWVPVLGNVIAVLFPRLFCMIIKNEPNIFSQWMNICPWEELLLLWHWMSLSKLFFFPQNLVSLYFAIIISGQFYWGNNIERKWNPFSPRFISDSAVSYSRSFPTYIFFIFTSVARVTHRIKLCWTSDLDCIDDSDSNSRDQLRISKSINSKSVTSL